MDEHEYERYLASVFGAAEMRSDCRRNRMSDEPVPDFGENDVCGQDNSWTQAAQ
jgi:hypothetical protein